MAKVIVPGNAGDSDNDARTLNPRETVFPVRLLLNEFL